MTHGIRFPPWSNTLGEHRTSFCIKCFVLHLIGVFVQHLTQSFLCNPWWEFQQLPCKDNSPKAVNGVFMSSVAENIYITSQYLMLQSCFECLVSWHLDDQKYGKYLKVFLALKTVQGNRPDNFACIEQNL